MNLCELISFPSDVKKINKFAQTRLVLEVKFRDKPLLQKHSRGSADGWLIAISTCLTNV